MKGLRSISYFYSRSLFHESVQECVKRRNFLNYVSRWTSNNVQTSKNNLPQEEERPEKLVEFGQHTLKKKPSLASSLADFADRSPILQKLIDLGVEIHKFDTNWDLCKFILSLDYEKNVEPYLSFLSECGIETESLGQYLTENPYILQCDFDDLKVRINYLYSKRFNKMMIAQLISGNPKWLSYKVKVIDSRLGDIQQMIKLNGDEVRAVALAYPKIVNVSNEKLVLNVIMLKEQLQLNKDEVKKIVKKKPVLLAKDTNDTLKSFYYLQNEMNIPHHLVIEQPEILLCRAHVLAMRHKFLVKLGRAQYDPKQPGYVPLQSFAGMNDEKFCQTVAMTTIDVFYNFQKTL